MQNDPSSALPADAKLLLGDLTLPVDPQDPVNVQTYRVSDQLAYAIGMPGQCGPNLTPTSASTSATPVAGEQAATGATCSEWIFLDADTGALLDQTYTSS
jgi:hypothetical protein